MNTKLTSLLLASVCAIGLCGAAAAQNMSAPAQSAPPASQPATPGGTSAMNAIPVDQQTTVSGVQVMCGGIGSDEADPRYANYPAKIEVAGGYGQWLGNNDITIAGEGQNVATHCNGPWFMAQLQPGGYTVTVTHGAASHTAHLRVAQNGQRKIVVRFPKLQNGKGDGATPFPS